VFIGETEFVDTENEANSVALYIYLAGPKFNQEKLVSDFSSHGPTFVESLKSFVTQHDRHSLARLTKEGSGLTFVLDGVKVELKHKEHFFLDARDMM
jgi:hypothetical protein